jgi:NADH dehydrogenase/NADH:ubiquinone oxidoreductase subunit G
MNAGGENIEIHHAEGRIYRIKPRFNSTVNKWWISDEARYGYEFVHAADRLHTPEELSDGTGSSGHDARTELSWDAAYAKVESTLRDAVAKNGPGSTLCAVSPFDSTEEIFLQIKYVRSIDPQAWLVLPPVRVDGTDKVFKNPGNGQTTFTLSAEKAPNRKGAEKMLAHFGGNICQIADIPSKKIAVAVVSADPIRPHNVDERNKAALAIPKIIRLGMGPAGLYERATFSLPTCSWAEKSGVYENAGGTIQPFAQAIPPLEDTRSTGQIFWNLLGLSGRYSGTAARALMASASLPDYANIPDPTGTVVVEEMEFAAL